MGRKPHFVVRPRLPHPPVAPIFHGLLSGHPAVSSHQSAPSPFQEFVQREMQIHSVNVLGELSVAFNPGLWIKY